MTLATLGPDDFQGRLREPAAGGRRRPPPALPFAAHPRLDAETGELFNFAIIPGRSNRLAFYRVDGNGCMDPPRFHALERFSFVHDFALTRRFICVLLPRAEFDLTAVLLGHRTPVGSLRLETDRPMQALLIPRDGGTARLFDAVPGFVFHIAQAFDRDDGTLVMDVIRYRDYPAFDELKDLFADPAADLLPRLERLVLEPAQGRCRGEPWPESVRDRGAELPTTAPGAVGTEHRVIYSLGAPAGRGVPFFTAVQRLDTVGGELIETDFGLDLPGEPILAGAGCGPDAAGWLLTLVYRGPERPSQLLVLDSRDLRLQATLTLPHALPPGFHGSWVERCRLG
jgi:all-trans-8'-apo-beta-carotenal 15,15'-oxygenase